MVTHPKRFLVAQTIFLGDVILTLPLVQRLKKIFPESEIDFLVHAKNANILENHPAISHIISFDKEGRHRGLSGMMKLAQELHSRRYDAAIILPGSIKTACVVFLARIPRRIGSDHSSGMFLFAEKLTFPQEARKPFRNRIVYYGEMLWRFFGGKNSFVSIFFNGVVKLQPELHAVARYVALLQPLGIAHYERETPHLYPSEKDEKVVDGLLPDGFSDTVLVAIAPGSVWATKRWPADYFAKLIQRISLSFSSQNVSFLLIGSSEDSDTCRVVFSEVKNAHVMDCSGKLTPLQSAEALRRCRLLVTNDTAPMHIAAAVGTPCVAIFGPTIPAFGFTPLGENHVIVEQQSLWCRPCTPHGGHRCPLGTHECMRGLSVDKVYSAVMELLKK